MFIKGEIKVLLMTDRPEYRMESDFRLEEKDGEELSEYLGTYVLINSPGGKPVSSGKLISVEDGYAFLSPHSSVRVHPRKGPIHGLTSKIKRVDLMNADITPTTERSIRALGRYNNSQNPDNGSDSEDSKD